MGCRVPQVALVLTSCSTRTQLRAAIMWFAAQTYHMLALLRWAGVQGVSSKNMKIRKAEISDVGDVAELVRSLSHFYLEEGQEELPNWFSQTLHDSSFRDRFTSIEYRNYVAEVDGVVVGYISVRNGLHLYHLFVLPTYHNKGIARSLWQFCVDELEIQRCTVRSSLYAIPIYSKFGFKPIDDVSYKDGIGFQPMLYTGASC
tara:strand:+ start:250 stop:855 length:606 start_codon:yes stop_codon:yes gene_type:complete